MYFMDYLFDFIYCESGTFKLNEAEYIYLYVI
jgi:hypothetical protein